MTDNEIVKAFKHYNWYKDNDITTTCVKSVLLRDAYYLMCRQQAEIERLSVYNEEIVNRIRKSAIKEFAERLKEKTPFYEGWGYITIEKIDNLVKEMGCGKQ